VSSYIHLSSSSLWEAHGREEKTGRNKNVERNQGEGKKEVKKGRKGRKKQRGNNGRTYTE
jgi:hypothetical protein